MVRQAGSARARACQAALCVRQHRAHAQRPSPAHLPAFLPARPPASCLPLRHSTAENRTSCGCAHVHRHARCTSLRTSADACQPGSQPSPVSQQAIYYPCQCCTSQPASNFTVSVTSLLLRRPSSHPCSLPVLSRPATALTARPGHSSAPPCPQPSRSLARCTFSSRVRPSNSIFPSIY